MMTPAERARLFAFVGYGCPSKASFLFIGEKEYTPGGTEFANCRIRASSFALPLEDKNRAVGVLAGGFAALGAQEHAGHFTAALSPGSNFDWNGGTPSRRSVSVWTWAALFVAAWRDPARCVANGPWFRSWADEYRRLGTMEGDTTLVELYPLPMKGVTTWPTEYVSQFGFRDADAYFQSVFPIGQRSPRESILVQNALAPLPASAVVIAYGRGGKGAEFWKRYDQLLSPRPSTYNGRTTQWHVVVPNRVEIAISSRGQLVARIGFPWTRPNANPATQEHVPLLTEALRNLRFENP